MKNIPSDAPSPRLVAVRSQNIISYCWLCEAHGIRAYGATKIEARVNYSIAAVSANKDVFVRCYA